MSATIVYGVPKVGQLELEALTGVLRSILATKLQLPPEEIFVFFPVDRMDQGLGEELVCSIGGFALIEEAAKPSALRKSLADAVWTQLAEFAKKNIPQCELIEIVVEPCGEARFTYRGHRQ